ncbi:hypothetical protein FC093_21420 [Ilyomonas limi]|uniref:DUF1574 domain-containing protein n=1 Tax=Ilyomonas limi TaxID=2575867 RepID=A0A4U3KV89_9BACT|nr:hypothetical protein [Ilyomonas limi]TKK64937.1 hypothetical protein FC093_21420 [Ilyomonas limi]
MKKFLTHFLVVALLIGVGCIALSAIIYTACAGDYYDEYELYEPIVKQHNFKEDTGSYNTLFIGTSKTYRHVNPLQFDSITGTKSYNLAYAGLYPFRLYDALNHIMEFKKSDSLKNVFIEIAALDLIQDNYDNDIYVYSLDFNKYQNAISTLSGGNFPPKIRAKGLFYYNRLLLYKYAGFGIIKYINNFLGMDEPADLNEPALQDYKKVTKEYRGYVSLNMQFDLLGGKDDETRKAFLEHGAAMTKRMVANYPQHCQEAQSDELTEYIISVANSLKEKGIHVYFVLPPRKMSDMNYLLNQRNVLSKSGFTVFDLSDPAKYPEFYKVENSYDIAHMNAYGAFLYTKTFATMVKPYLNK